MTVDLYEYVTSADGYIVLVAEHTDETLREAAEVLAVAVEGIDSGIAPHAMEWFRGKAAKATLRSHLSEPDGNCIGDCEDATWWCEDGDAEPGLFWCWDQRALTTLFERAEGP